MCVIVETVFGQPVWASLPMSPVDAATLWAELVNDPASVDSKYWVV